MTRKAPYRHPDGSNCWTKDCSRGSRSVSDVVKTVRPHVVPGRLRAGLPEGVKPFTHSGAVLNKHYKFATTHMGGYDPEKVEPTRNPTEDWSMTKPYGGVWVATGWEDEDGEFQDDWVDMIGPQELNRGAKRSRVELVDDARVFVIDSPEAYKALLDAYPHRREFKSDDASYQAAALIASISERKGSYLPPMWGQINEDGTVKRTVDFEKAAGEYDAILVTWKGLYDCGKGPNARKNIDGAVSLYLWDIESMFVMNSAALKVIS